MYLLVCSLFLSLVVASLGFAPTTSSREGRLRTKLCDAKEEIPHTQSPHVLLEDIQENTSILRDCMKPADLSSGKPQNHPLRLTQAPSLDESLSHTVLLGLGTFALTTLLGHLLVNFEWVQSWRYFWPLVGGLYVVHAGQQLFPVNSSLGTRINVLPFAAQATWWNIVAGIFGVGLIIGGAYDAFMPVWMTGPNVFTEAGIGHDSAAGLLLLSGYASTLSNSLETSRSASDSSEHGIGMNTNSQLSTQLLLLQVVLLSQLCILGEGTINAVVSDVSTLLLPS